MWVAGARACHCDRKTSVDRVCPLMLLDVTAASGTAAAMTASSAATTTAAPAGVNSVGPW